MEEEEVETVVPSLRLSRSRRIEFLQNIDNKGICWFYPPDIPWSLSYYLSEAGQSNIHIYLWLAKDLSWIQVQSSSLNNNLTRFSAGTGRA